MLILLAVAPEADSTNSQNGTVDLTPPLTVRESVALFLCIIFVDTGRYLSSSVEKLYY